MTTPRLQNRKVAILVEDGFEQEELTRPRQALQEAGAETAIISPAGNKVKGWDHTDWGEEFEVDFVLDEAQPELFDALLLPGGVMNPDKLRRNEQAQDFVRHFFAERKPVAAICHAPWILIDTGLAPGRTLTSYHSLQTDLKNAGATWEDREVVVDGCLITSRNPDDIPAFNRELIAALEVDQPEPVR